MADMTLWSEKPTRRSWLTEPQLKLPFTIPGSGSTTFYDGQAAGRDANGTVVQMDDTLKAEFVGFLTDAVQEVVNSTDAAGDDVGYFHQPRAYVALIAAAAQGDEGKKVYWLYNNQVQYAYGANGNYAGTVLMVVDSTHVLVLPPWMAGVTLGGFKGVFAAPATGGVTLTKWDVNKIVLLPLTANSTVTLPAASKTSPGDEILFVNTGTGGFVPTFAPAGTDRINNVNASITMPGTAYGSTTLVSDGTQWFVADTELWEPSSVLTAFGGASASAVGGAMREEGNVYVNAGAPIAGNAADTTDDILGGFQLPASVFDKAGRQLNIIAQGTTGATTNNKRFKIFVNPTMSGQTVNADGSISGGTVTAGTPICDSGAWVNATTPNNAAGWLAQAVITKYGAAGSNTQKGQGQAILGTLHGGVQAGQSLTLPENAVVNVVVTGSSYTTGAANDVKLEQLTISGAN